MKKLCFSTVLSAMGMLVFAGCEEGAKTVHVVEPMVVSGVVRILANDDRDYTFFIKKVDGTVGRLRIQVYNKTGIRILEDIPNDGVSRVEYVCGRIDSPRSCTPIPETFSYWHVHSASQMTMHLRSVKEIGGGSWNHGKQGRGTVGVVE